MTDRVRHLTITLDHDIRTDDVEVLAQAIRMLRGVSSVETQIVTLEDHHARMSVRADIQRRLHQAIADVFNPPSDGKGGG